MNEVSVEHWWENWSSQR